MKYFFLALFMGFSFVDLIDEKIENFISSTDYGAYITIAHWMGQITDEEFEII